MPKEIKILIPDTDEGEVVDIKVVANGKEMVQYRLEVTQYPEGKTSMSRADFVKEKIDNYDRDFVVVEIGVDSENRIPILFRHITDNIIS